MDKRSNIMQALGRSSRMLGSVGGPTAPSFYKGWGGPLTGAAVKGLAFGLPAYGLTRLALKATGKDKEMDSHRAGLLSGILSGVGAAGMDLMNVGDNFRLAPGGIMGGLKSLNKDPGVVEGQLMGKQADYNGSMRGTQGGAIQSGEGGNFSGPGCKVRQEDPPSMRQNRSNKAKGDTMTFASSDSGGQITDHPELVNGPVVKEALARVSKYLVTAQKSKQADYSDPDYNTSGAFMNYSTYVPPGYQMTIPAHYTAAQIDNDPYMSPQAKAQALMHIDNASDGRPGLITVNDITRAAVGAGIGYASASLFGRVLGGLFGGLSPQTQRTMQQTGAVAGLLMNTGAIGGR